jgi:hypothetical protein
MLRKDQLAIRCRLAGLSVLVTLLAACSGVSVSSNGTDAAAAGTTAAAPLTAPAAAGTTAPTTAPAAVGTTAPAAGGTTAPTTAPAAGGTTAPTAPTAPADGTATLTWSAPTEDANGSPIIGLAGYNIHYGTDPSNLTESINVAGASATTYTVTGLSAGTYYFAVAAFNSEGVDSALSNIGEKTI